jgi:hypothetical protein
MIDTDTVFSVRADSVRLLLASSTTLHAHLDQ